MSGENSVMENSNENYRLPQGVTLQHCAKLGIVEDKPIMFDYWTCSCDKEVLIGVHTEYLVVVQQAWSPAPPM